MKFLIFVVLGMITIKNVFSLNCYIMDLGVLKAGVIETSVQDCNDNINGILKRVPSVDISSLKINFRCYKASAASDSVKLVMKGCVPKGGCKIMSSHFKFLVAKEFPKVVDDDITCDECSGNQCNSANREKSVFSFIVLVLIAFTVINT